MWIEGQRAARTLDVSLHCTMLDAPLFMPLGAPGVNAPGSPNVVVGGCPCPSLMDMAMAGALELGMRGISRLARRLHRARKALAKQLGEVGHD